MTIADRQLVNDLKVLEAVTKQAQRTMEVIVRPLGHPTLTSSTPLVCWLALAVKCLSENLRKGLLWACALIRAGEYIAAVRISITSRKVL